MKKSIALILWYFSKFVITYKQKVLSKKFEGYQQKFEGLSSIFAPKLFHFFSNSVYCIVYVRFYISVCQNYLKGKYTYEIFKLTHNSLKSLLNQILNAESSILYRIHIIGYIHIYTYHMYEVFVNTVYRAFTRGA